MRIGHHKCRLAVGQDQSWRDGIARFLKEAGFEGFLMGENFMKYSRPEKACKEFIDQLNNLENKTI